MREGPDLGKFASNSTHCGKGADGQCWQKGQRDQDDRHTDDQSDELRFVGGQGADRRRRGALTSQRTGQRKHHNHRQEPSDKHRQTECGVVPDGVGSESGERRTVVVRRRGERIQHFRKAVRSGVRHAGALAGQG